MEKSKKCKALPHLRRPKSRGTIKLHSNLEKDDAANKIFKVRKFLVNYLKTFYL